MKETICMFMNTEDIRQKHPFPKTLEPKPSLAPSSKNLSLKIIPHPRTSSYMKGMNSSGWSLIKPAAFSLNSWYPGTGVVEASDS